MTYRYRTLYRPAGFATLPSGLVYRMVERPHGETWNPRTDLVLSPHRYGVFETNRPLTEAELATFQIVPA